MASDESTLYKVNSKILNIVISCEVISSLSCADETGPGNFKMQLRNFL